MGKTRRFSGLVANFIALTLTVSSCYPASENDATAEPAPITGGATTSANPGVTSPAQQAGTVETVEWPATNSQWFDTTLVQSDYDVVDFEQRVQLNLGNNGNQFAFVRFNLGTELLANEITQAKLYLAVTESPADSALNLTAPVIPTEIDLGLLTSPWYQIRTTNDEALAIIDSTSVHPVPTNTESNGWVSVPVTDEVLDWLNGDYQNNGLVLAPTNATDTISFDGQNAYLEITGQVGDRARNFGKFGYGHQVSPEGTDTETGNCMSYALRDTDMILFWNLGLDYDQLNELYATGGEYAVLENVAEHVENYVAAHADGLAINSFRRIANYDSPIDPATEYRIALRITAYAEPGLPMSDNGGFDYHFWAQLNDGRWAQKFPLSESQIIPGTAADIDPGKYPWNATSENWGVEKYTDIYQSPVIYYAVSKTTNNFTTHLQPR